MNILMLTHDFLPNVGGVTTHIKELAIALYKQGHTVTILHSLPKSGKNKKYDLEGVKVIDYFTLKTGIRLIDFLINIVGVWFFLFSFARKHNIDVLHLHTFDHLAWASKFLCKKNIHYIFTNHTSGYLERYEKSFRRWYLRWNLSHFTKIIAPSRELADKSDILVDAHHRFFISNGVNSDVFIPLSKNQALLNKRNIKDRQVILATRRLEPKNGIPYLVAAMPLVLTQIPHSVLVLVGHGGYFAEEKKLKTYVKEHGIENDVIFVGDVANDMILPYYSIADVVVFPSLMEATSISCLEAMSCAKPIVSTNVGGLPELVKEGKNGHLVPPKDSLALAQAIIRLLSAPEKNIFGKQSREIVMTNFDRKVVAQKTLAVYKQ